jgi:hypothetical protein
MRNLFLLILVLPAFSATACKCPHVDLSVHIEKVYDVIVGKVIGGKDETVECGYGSASYQYSVRVDYSYKNILSDTIEIYGSNGWGDCGVVLEEGRHFQIAVFKCKRGYYSSMCVDNNFLPDAGFTLKYLNKYFNVNYHPVTKEFVIISSLVSFFIVLILSLTVIRNVHRYRSKRFRRQTRYHTTISITLPHR